MKSRTLLSAFVVVTCLAGVVLFCAKKSPTSIEEKDFTGTISGYVYSKLDSLPLKDVIVSINADSSTPGMTNASGAFMIGKVAAGTHRLHFSRLNYEGDTTHTIDVSLGETAKLTDTVRLSYGYYIIAGTVNNSGTSPVPGAGVAIPGTDRSTLTDLSGDFELREVPKNSSVKIICAKGGIGFNVATITELKSDVINTIDPIHLNQEGATVSGTVLDSTGRPMANVVVRAVGGGIVDTTKADGSYTLRNVPSGESGVQITAVGAGTTSGSLTGIEASGGITGADIMLHGPVSAVNGMALSASNTVMEEGMDSVTLHVYPTTASEIRKYNWYVKQSTTVTKTTTLPSCTISRIALQKITAKSAAAGSFNITVWVEAENTLGQLSAKIEITVLVRSSIPEISASGWTVADTAKRDTVRTIANTFVTLKGTAIDLVGGIDTLEWDFGDSSMKWSANDSLPQINHLYVSQGTYRAVFRVKDIDKNEVKDTVVIIASAPPISAPALASPADGDTSAKAGNHVTLVWHPLAAGAGITYNVYLDYLNDPPITKIGSDLSDTSLSVAIDSGKTYYWRVESVKGADKASSIVRSFSSGKLAPAGNHAPQFTTSPMTLTATVGLIYKDTIHATDGDADPLAFAFKDSVAGMQLRDSVITWTPVIGDTGSKTISVLVNDGKSGKDTLIWTIAVMKDQSSGTIDLARGLVAYYPFNGDANDVSGNGRNGVLVGANPTFDRFGNYQQAYFFDGAGDSISLPSGTYAGENYCWAFWYKPAIVNSQYRTLFQSTSNLSVYTNGTSLRIYGTNGSSGAYERVVDGMLTLGKWTLIGLRYTSDNLIVYKDGIAFDTVSTSITATPNKAIIGGNSQQYFAQGAIDDVRIYNRALSNGEMLALYNENGWSGTPPVVQSKLSSLVSSTATLSPSFNADSLSYSITVGTTVTSMTFTATVFDQFDTILVNGVRANSGAVSSVVTIGNGNNIVTITVKDDAGLTSRVYTITVTKTSGTTTAADLTGLGVSVGALVPAFHYETITYNDTVANNVQGIRITPTARDPGAVIKVNTDTVKSDSLSKVINLTTGLNTITITVYAPGGTSTQTYTLRVYRRLGANANLAGLTVSKGALSPAFDSTTLIYRDTVNNDTSAVSLTPRCADSLATVKVKGVTVVKGESSASIALTARLVDTIPVLVTSQDGVSTKTYSVIVVRRKSANADLKGITLSSGVISPSFGKDALTYNVSVDNGVTSVSVTPTLADTSSTALTVNGTAVKSGAASAAIALTVGVTDSFAIKIVAQDGVTEKTYKVRVSRENPQNALSGFISANRTLTAAESPYYIATGVIVDSGVTLTIDPGVRIKMGAGAAITIDGTLKALGTSGSPITFTTSAPGTNWGYILFSNRSVDAQYDGNGDYVDGSILKNCVVEYGGGATVTNNGAVRCDGAHPYFEGCVVRNSKVFGIITFNMTGTIKMVDCLVRDNTYGIVIGDDGKQTGVLTVNRCSVLENIGGGLWFYGQYAQIFNTRFKGNIGLGLCLYNYGPGTQIVNDTFIDNINSAASNNGNGAGLALNGSTNHVLVDSCLVAGNSITGGSTRYGGGIYVSQIRATIRNSVISSNTAYAGGGIFTTSDSVTIENCVIDSNKATGGAGGGCYLDGGAKKTFNKNMVRLNSSTTSIGGGLYVNTGNLTFNENTIQGNTASSVTAGDGGGAYFNSVTVDNTLRNTFAGNVGNRTVGGGGGIYLNACSGVFNDLLIKNNRHSNAAGGLNITGISSPGFSFNKCSFSSNSAGNYAGGVSVSESSNPAIFTDCIIDSNTAEGSIGGGIRVYHANCGISHCKISNNLAQNYPAIYYYSYTSNPSNLISFNNISNNTATGSSATSAIFIDSLPTFTNNNITNNTATYMLYNNNAQSKGPLIAENNYWGTTDEAAIDAKVYDYFEDINKSVVDIRPILTAPEPTVGPQ